MENDETITITFGEQAENHVGMQKVGSIAKEGFTHEELLSAQNLFEKEKFVCEMIHLNEALQDVNISAEDAYVLVIRKGISAFVDVTQLFLEQKNLTPDTKAFMYGRVVNKKTRHNLCFSDKPQEPDYLNKMGRIVAFSDTPLLSIVRNKLPAFFGEKADKMEGEGNYYYDITKCGIGFHGDSERKRVIALRLGATLPLRYRWFYNGTQYGKDVTIELNNGDMYAMSALATGYNWRKRSIPTLRHATGCAKFIT